MANATAEQPKDYRWRFWLAAAIPSALAVGTLVKSISDHDDFGLGYLPVIAIIVFAIGLVSAPLWTILEKLTVEDEGLNASSFFGTSVFVPWEKIDRIGLYTAGSMWGTDRLLKIIRKNSSGLTTRAIFFVPLNEHISNFDGIVSEILKKPVVLDPHPRTLDRVLWGAREIETPQANDHVDL